MYQVVGVDTNKVYAELDSPEEGRRYILKKFPNERMGKRGLVVVNPVLPEPMRIVRK